MKSPLVLFIVGPTATGKSDLAVDIAEACARVSTKVEIVNCDSVQFFAGVDIGAAKPDENLLRRAKHHLIGHVPLGGAYTAGDFRRDALQIIEEGPIRGVERFLAVGGSGFYVQALEKGMFEVPEVPEEVRERLEAEADAPGGLEALYTELRDRDPEAAARISPRDRYRILRALEIIRSDPSGSTLSEIKKRFIESAQEAPFTSAKIGLVLDRDVLRKRVRERASQMLKAGLIDEVKGLRAKGLKDWSPLKSVGYREVQAMLDGQIELKDLEDAIVTSTMQLAKKQMTWFKRDQSIQWFDALKERSKAVELGQKILSS